MLSVEERFRIWFDEPIDALRKLEKGHGGFVALAIALPLFERYNMYLNYKDGTKVSREARLATEFNITAGAETIWDLMRNGMLHGAAVKNGCQLDISGEHSKVFELTTDNPPIFKFHVWDFVDKVLALWRPHVSAFDWNKTFPLPNIYLRNTLAVTATTPVFVPITGVK